MLKLCPKCNIEKEISSFHKDKTHTDGYRSICKSCKSLYDSKYRVNNKQRRIDISKIYRNKNKEAITKKNLNYYKNNRLTILKKDADYYSKNRDQKLKYQAVYYSENKDSVLTYNSNRTKQKCEDSPEYKETLTTRRYVTYALKPIILKRDNYCCQLCFSKNRLEAHHIIPIKTDPSKVEEIDNLITLCHSCHKKAHAGNWRTIDENIIIQLLNIIKQKLYNELNTEVLEYYD